MFIKSLDDSQCGITYKMESVYSMLKEKDMDLYMKLVSKGLLGPVPKPSLGPFPRPLLTALHGSERIQVRMDR